jgi:hypothetical protein
MIEFIITLLLMIWCSVFARMAGGGIWTNRPANLGEALMTVMMGGAVMLTYDNFWVALAAFVWSYLFFQTGHAVAFQMASPTAPDYRAGGRTNELDKVLDPIFRALGVPLSSHNAVFCWVFMGTKGLLMTLPLGWWAALGAVLWPSGYYIGNRICPRFFPHTDGEMVAEHLSGAMYGLLVALYFFGMTS